MDQQGQSRELSRILVASTINSVLGMLSKASSFSCTLDSFTTKLNELRSSYIAEHHPLCLAADEKYSAADITTVIKDKGFALVAYLNSVGEIVFNIDAASFSADLINCAVSATVAYTALLIQEVQRNELELKENLNAQSSPQSPQSLPLAETIPSNGEPIPVSIEGIEDGGPGEVISASTLTSPTSGEPNLSVDNGSRIAAETKLRDPDFDEKIDEFTKLNDVSSDALDTDPKNLQTKNGDQDIVGGEPEHMNATKSDEMLDIDAGPPMPVAANTDSGSNEITNPVAHTVPNKEAPVVDQNLLDIARGDVNSSERILDSSESRPPAILHDPRQSVAVVPLENPSNVTNTAESESLEDEGSMQGIQGASPRKNLKIQSQPANEGGQPVMNLNSTQDGPTSTTATTDSATEDPSFTRDPEAVDGDSPEKAPAPETAAAISRTMDLSMEVSRKRTAPAALTPQQQKRFQSIATRLVTSIQEHRFSLPFLQPVNPRDAPDYAEMIYEPRDLKNISRLVKLKSDPPAYTSIKHLERDIMLMCANCIMYNKSNDDLARLTISMRNDVKAIFKMYEEAELEI